MENKEKNKISLTVAKKVIPEWEKLKLKPKEIKFLTIYINNGFNGTEAYLNSIARSGTSKEAAKTEGGYTLRKPHISKAFKLWKEMYIEVSKEMLEPAIVEQLKRRAFYDIAIFQDDDGEMRPLSEIPEEWRCCVDGTERKYYGKDADVCVVVSKLADRDKAMEKLSKYIGMIEEKGESGSTTINVNIKNNLMNVLMGKRE